MTILGQELLSLNEILHNLAWYGAGWLSGFVLGKIIFDKRYKVKWKIR